MYDQADLVRGVLFTAEKLSQERGKKKKMGAPVDAFDCD